MKSFAGCLISLLYSSLCFSLKVPRNFTEKNNLYKRLNITNDDSQPKSGTKDTASIPPDNILDQIKNIINLGQGAGRNPYESITTKPFFVQGNDSFSCYPEEYFHHTPNWWGKGPTPFPPNPVFRTNDEGCNEWGPCTVTAGGVGILYFPTGSDAISYETTHSDTGMQYMFKSPTVYLVFQTVWGWATDSNFPTGIPGPTRLPANNPVPWQTSMPMPMLEPANPQNPQQTQGPVYIDRLSSLREDLRAITLPPTQGNGGGVGITIPVPVQSQASGNPGSPAQSQTPGNPGSTAQSQAPGNPGSPAQSQAPGNPRPLQPLSPGNTGNPVQSEVLEVPTSTSNNPPTQIKRGVQDLGQNLGSVWAMPVGGLGQLGPTIANKFFAFQLNEISTLHPYSDAHAQGNMAPSQLQLSDLYSDCPETADYSSLSSQTHPVIGDRGYRCFPRFAIPAQLLEGGKPWWDKCTVLDIEKGLVDPPIAFTVAKRGLIPSAPADPGAGNGNHPPTRHSLQDGLPPKTTSMESSPTSTDPVNIPRPNSDDTPGSPDPKGSSSNLSPGHVENPGISPHNPVSDQPPVQVASNSPPNRPSEMPNQIIPGQEISGGIVSISPVISSDGLSLAPAVVISGGSTLQPGSGVTLPAKDGSGKSVYVSVVTDSDQQGNSPKKQTLILSTLGAVSVSSYNVLGDLREIATQSPGMPVNSRDDATVVYMDATLVKGGEIRTASNVVLSYGPSGVVVEYPGGVVSTFLPSSLPTAGIPNDEPGVKGFMTDGMRNGRKSQDFISPQSMVESSSAIKASSSTSGKGGTYSKQITITAFINTATPTNNPLSPLKPTSSKKKNEGGVLANERKLWLIMFFIFLRIFLEISG